jgi:putative nucleotidyltransferase with HDIG domain
MRKIVDVLSKYDDFWQHAMKTALYAQTLARETGKCDPSAAFTAGLLHDIGHLLKKLGSAEFEKLMSGQDIVLPTDTHAEWGALLGGKWNLPLTIIEAIRFHHMPELAQTDVSLVSAVHMADYLSSEEEGFEYEEEILRCSLFACTTLGVDSKIMENPDQVEIFKTMKAHSMASTDALFSAAMKNTIIDALASLPEEERVVVALRYYDTLGFHEIGQLCGYDMKTAEMLHNKAISRLKNMFLPEKLQGE